MAWIGGSALAILAAALLLPGFFSPRGGTDFVDSRFPNVDASNGRHAGGPITVDTVSDLEVAWSLPITAKNASGGNVASPVIAGGVVYSQDLASNVQAIELESGQVLWKKSYESLTAGPNGVLLAGGLVYGATASDAFALDQETGEEVWATPLTRTHSEQIRMAPGYHNRLVYFSTGPGDFQGGEAGVLWALGAKTGQEGVELRDRSQGSVGQQEPQLRRRPDP